VVTPARDREALDQAIVRGSELLKQGKLDEAQRAFRAALDLDPENAKVLALLGLSHFRANQFDLARPIYEALVDLAPTDASHRLNLGLVYLKLNDAEHAITSLEASRAIDPSQGRAVSYLGLAYARAGRYAEAYRSFLLAGQHELATEIEVNLTPPERDAIHNQLGRTPAGPQPAVARTLTPHAISRTVTPPADVIAVPRTRSEPRTKPPSAPPPKRSPSQELAVVSTAAVEMSARQEVPRDSQGMDAAPEHALGRPSDPAFALHAPTKSPAPATSPARPAAAALTDSQVFVMVASDPAAPLPLDGRSMVSLAVAAATPPSLAAPRTPAGGMAARPLSELATEELVSPDDGTDTFEIAANGALVIRVTERVMLRLDGVHVTGGDLTYEVAMRRSRGHQTDEPFDDGGTPLHAVSGRGYLIAIPPATERFTAVVLDDDILYLREDLVFAFEATLRWENGNVPGLRGKLHVVQFRGDGALALRLERPLVRIKLPPQGLVLVEAERLAGWIGRVIPRAVVSPRGGPMGTMCVECTGEGVVLVEPAPAPTAPAAQRASSRPLAAAPPAVAPAQVPEPPAQPPDTELADFAASMREASDPADEI